MTLFRLARSRFGKIPARLRWALFFAVCALGYVLFVSLARRLDPNARPRWTIDRAAAIEQARDFAAEQGSEVSPTGGWWSRWWNERVTGQAQNEEVGRYLRSHQGPVEQLVRHLVPDLQARAQLLTPAGDLLEVRLDPEGRRVGFRRRFPDEPALSAAPAAPPESSSGGDADQERAREIAWASLVGRLESPDVIRFQLEDVEENRALPGPPIYTFTWKGHCEELPELTVGAMTAVREETLTRERFWLDLETPDSGLRSALTGAVLTVLILLALVHATLRLVRRAKEGEVSRSRGLVLGGIFFVPTALQPWFVDDTLRQSNALINLLGGAFNGALGALVLAFVWIALEGDIREALPGKLTALDTLLSGRLLSRDVARSSLVGIALAGPALGLLQATRLLPGTGTEVANELASLFSASMPFFALYVQPGILFTGVVIFIPLSFLLLRTRSPQQALVLFAVIFPAFSLVVSLLDSDNGVPEIAYGVTMAAFMLVPFLAHDLLAALWTTYVMATAPRILYLSQQPSAALRTDGLAVTALAGLGVLAILALLRWGRTYNEEEVRPVYARNLAERLELLAERKLAGEALDRLLPGTLPEIPGATLAASCHRGSAPSGGTGGENTAPSEGNGGENTSGDNTSGGSRFYDLLALPEDRLGIALVDLEGGGAAAALRLALLKGLLKTCSPRRTSPVDVLEGVQRRLQVPGGPPAEPFTGTYAIFDPASRTLRYTRRGAASMIFLRRSDGAVVALEGSDVADAEVALEPGDAVIFASGDGVLTAADGSGPRTLSNALSGFRDANADTLHTSIGRLMSDADAEGDRTLVVVSIDLSSPDHSSPDLPFPADSSQGGRA